MRMKNERLGSGYRRKKPLPFPLGVEELTSIAEGINQTHPPYGSLFAMCYIFGLRISEALSIKARDLEYNRAEDVWVLRVITKKRKDASILRVLPSLCKEGEDKLLRMIEERHTGTDPAELMFDTNRKLAYFYFQKNRVEVNAVDFQKREIIDMPAFKMHPHYLRHCRLTHLVTYYGFDLFKLTQYAGWTSPNVAMTYVNLDWRNLLTGKA